MNHINIIVKGKVQEVWFRDSTRREANRLDIMGFARNEPDGSVYIEAEGTEENLEKLVQWCHIGSPQSNVSEIEITEGEIQYFENFSIH